MNAAVPLSRAASDRRLTRAVHALLFAVIALTVPLAPAAAGLGALEVRSQLGQPLVASAPVLVVEQGQRITAAVGSAQAYRDAGLPYDASLAGTRIDVEKGPDGSPILQIRGTQAPAEPVVQLLVEVRLPGGVLVGHYVVLLDTPGAAIAQAFPAESVTSRPLEPPVVVAESPEPASTPKAVTAESAAAAPKSAARPAEQKPQPSALRRQGSIPPPARHASAQSESSALMEAEPLMHVRNGQVQGCGLRLTGGEPGKQASSWFDVSFNVFRRGPGLAQSIAYEIQRSEYEGDSRPTQVPVQSTWLKVSDGATRLGENTERRDTLIYTLLMDDVLALFEAVANGDAVTLGIKRWGQRVDAIYTGAPLLSTDSRHRMSSCLADLALG